MRRVTSPTRGLALAAAGAAAVACASMQAPPGGPPDDKPPQVLRVSPDSGTVNFKGRAVEFRFDEVISDRGTGTSALPQLILISPRDGLPRVAWRRQAITVRPRSGWRPNTAYSITLLPGVTDLRGNTSREGRTVVVTTGPTVPQLSLRGRVFDWLAERPAPRAWVEAISRPDSVVYVAVADSAGSFTVGPLPEGSYTLRAFVDQNNNRALDRGEAWDSIPARPRAGVVTSFELLAAPRDTAPPRISNVAFTDSVTLTVEFDRPLDPGQTITSALFAVVGADSTPVPVREAVPRADFERRQEAERARADSARADSARAGRPAGQQQRLVRGVAAAQQRPSLPPPPTQVVLRAGALLVPGSSYRVTATGVRNLLGRSGSSSRVIQVPRPAPADTTRRAPTAPPPR